MIEFDELFERALKVHPLRRRSERRRTLGLGTRREISGLDRRGRRKLFPTRKRPKKSAKTIMKMYGFRR